MQVATGWFVAWLLDVQVSFNFIQVWGGEFNAKSPRMQRRKGTKGKGVYAGLLAGGLAYGLTRFSAFWITNFYKD